MKTFLIYSRTHHGVSGNSRQWYDKNLWVEICHTVTCSVQIWYGSMDWPGGVFIGCEHSSCNIDSTVAVEAHWDLEWRMKWLMKNKCEMAGVMTLPFPSVYRHLIVPFFFHHEKAFPALPSTYIQEYILCITKESNVWYSLIRLGWAWWNCTRCM